MDAYLEGLMKVIEKSRSLNKSKAPVITTPCNYVVSNNPNRVINPSSKSASLPKEPEAPVIEGIPHYAVNKARAISEFLKSNGTELPKLYEVNPGSNQLSGPKGWKEQQNNDGSVVYSNPNSKAASVSGINKVKPIHDFLFSNGRL